MILNAFFLLFIFTTTITGMEQPEPKWYTIARWQEMEYFQELIIAYKPRLKLQESPRNVISERWNYAYVVPHMQLFTELGAACITQVPMKIPISKKPYLMIATLSTTPEHTRLMSDSTMKIEPLAMRIVNHAELQTILMKMKNSKELEFNFIRHEADSPDTSYILKRYSWHEIELLKELDTITKQTVTK